MSSTSLTCCVSKNLILHVIDASFLVTILVIQGSILNYYIISYFSHSVNPYFWFIADFSCLFVFTGALTISYQYLNKAASSQHQPSNCKYGALPLSYLSWLLYSGILLGKVVMIFKLGIPDNITDKNVLLLQGTISVSGLVFLLLAEGHDGSKRNSPRHLYVTSMCAKTGIELLDVVSFLSLLLVNDTHIILTYGLENAILILCCIDLLLPALALYKLSLGDVERERFLLPTIVIYNLLHLLLIDLPFLGVRLYIWVYYNKDASLFVMKNIFRIIAALRGIYPDVHELVTRPKRRVTDTDGRTSSMELEPFYKKTSDVLPGA